jgi:hypothetical protein
VTTTQLTTQSVLCTQKTDQPGSFYLRGFCSKLETIAMQAARRVLAVAIRSGAGASGCGSLSAWSSAPSGLRAAVRAHAGASGAPFHSSAAALTVSRTTSNLNPGVNPTPTVTIEGPRDLQLGAKGKNLPGKKQGPRLNEHERKVGDVGIVCRVCSPWPRCRVVACTVLRLFIFRWYGGVSALRVVCLFVSRLGR